MLEDQVLRLYKKDSSAHSSVGHNKNQCFLASKAESLLLEPVKIREMFRTQMGLNFFSCNGSTVLYCSSTVYWELEYTDTLRLSIRTLEYIHSTTVHYLQDTV